MFPWLAFQHPWYLVLLAVLPLLWVLSYRSLSGLGGWRRIFAIGLRTLVLMLIIFALADAQYRRTNDRMTVIYLLDQSLSIPEPHRQAMLEFVERAVEEHRDKDKEDRVGVIVFGREAEVELPPVDFTPPLDRVESLLDRQHTNLAGALQRARALFPHDSTKRVVIVTDGNENLGDALAQARSLADAGIGIDVLPVPLARPSEISVDKIALPVDVRRGQPFELRVVLDNDTSTGQKVAGKLRIVRKAGETERTISEEPVELDAGKSVFARSETIQESDFYTYEARFVPDDVRADAYSQNNLATAFTHVRGKGHVLFIEDWENPGESDHLVERLRREEVEVTVQPSNQLFNSLAELQRYDTVVLADVPRSGGSDANNVSSFTDTQIEMLVRNTSELGCGLLMIGGSKSFGAGGWTNTELEKAMPVDFRIKNARVIPVGALALVIDRSGSMDGEKLAMSKAAAAAAVRTLGPRDFVTVVAFDSAPYNIVPIQRVGDGNRITRQIDRITSGGGTDLYPGMVDAFQAIKKADAAVKHMIVLTDGQTPPQAFDTLTREIRRNNITVSSVGVGDDVAQQLLTSIATLGGGKYYAVKNPNVIPRVFMTEARRVAQPLVKELAPPVSSDVVADHEILRGIDTAFPPISGFVMTSVKESSLVEVILRSPVPAVEENSTILATWTYGLGKAGVFTTDSGGRWANQWTGWSHYDRFFSQLVRWSMRATGDTGNYSLSTDVRDAKTRVVIDALDKDNEFLNSQMLTGSVIGPRMESIPFTIEQIAPGRYVGEFASADPGSYLILIVPPGGQGMIRTGVNVGYSDEFRDREANTPLLETMAKLPTRDGQPGKLITAESGATFENAEVTDPLVAVNPYRRDLAPAVATRDIWPLLVLACCCLFVGDVFVRRVQIGWAWNRVSAWVMRRQATVESPVSLSRLRSRKQQVQQQLATRHAAARFKINETRAPSESPVEALAGSAAQLATRTSRTVERMSDEDLPAADSYTSRLLKAKKQVWQDRDGRKG
ncbi:MAG: VWA domain-containing protein [Pirellulales bacterium]